MHYRPRRRGKWIRQQQASSLFLSVSVALRATPVELREAVFQKARCLGASESQCYRAAAEAGVDFRDGSTAPVSAVAVRSGLPSTSEMAGRPQTVAKGQKQTTGLPRSHGACGHLSPLVAACAECSPEESTTSTPERSGKCAVLVTGPRRK